MQPTTLAPNEMEKLMIYKWRYTASAILDTPSYRDPVSNRLVLLKWLTAMHRLGGPNDGATA